MALCLCGQMQVNAATTDDGTNEMVSSGINEDMLRQIEPTYLKEVATLRMVFQLVRWYVWWHIYLCRKAAWYREHV